MISQKMPIFALEETTARKNKYDVELQSKIVDVVVELVDENEMLRAIKQ